MSTSAHQKTEIPERLLLVSAVIGALAGLAAGFAGAGTGALHGLLVGTFVGVVCGWGLLLTAAAIVTIGLCIALPFVVAHRWWSER